MLPARALLKRADAALPGREERPRRAARRALGAARTAPGRPAAACRARPAGWRGSLAAEREARSRPRPCRCRQAARGARVGFPGRRRPARNPRGRLTALFAAGRRTCKLSPAHMLHIKPPCPVSFLSLSFFFLRKGSYKLPLVYLAWFSLLQFCMGCLCLVY